MLSPLVCVMLVVTAAPAPDSHDEVIKDTIKAVTEVCDAMDMVKDKATAEQNKEKLKAMSARLDELKKRADKLGPPSAEVQKKIAEQYLAAFQKLLPRMLMVQKKLEMPEIKAVLGDLKLNPQ